MTGGPPVRGELLAYWEPGDSVSDDERARWNEAARRIATGLGELAHLSVTIDDQLFVVAFACDKDVRLATRYEAAIRSENIEARIVEGGDGTVGIALPCRPDATDEEIRHAVLAGLKAAHTVEFVQLDPDVLAELQLVRALEACVVDFGRLLKRAGSRLKGA